MPSKKPAITTRVSPNEQQQIIEDARRAGLSISEYVRRVCLGHRVPSYEKAQSVRELIRVNGDLGRLGGLLKLWLMNEDSHQVQVKQLLHELITLKDDMARKIREL